MQLKNIVIIAVIFVMLSGIDSFSRSLRPTGSDKRPAVDWVEAHSTFLSSMGVRDLSDDGLITLLKETEDTLIIYHTVLLLGRRGVKEAIPSIEAWLIKKDIHVQIAAAKALLMLGNVNGVETLKKICQGNDENKALDAAGVLARHGFIDAIPYLIKFSKREEYFYRLDALKHMKSLAEKLDAETIIDQEKGPTKDIVNSLIRNMLELLSDRDIRVRKGALRFLSNMNVKDKRPIIEGLKKRVDMEEDKKLATHIRWTIRRLEKEIKSLEK